MFYFRLCNRLLRSYLDPDLDPLQRVEYAFYVKFALEAWYTDLKEKDVVVKKQQHLVNGMEKARICAENNWTVKQYNEEMKKRKKEEKEAQQRAKEEATIAALKAKMEQKQRKKQKTSSAATTTMTCPAPLTTAPLSIPASASVVLTPSGTPFASPATLTSVPPPRAPALLSDAPTPATRRTVATKFITRTAAVGASLNAWFLLAFIDFLTQHDDLRKEIPFVTRLLTEQSAEKVFRALRAVLGGENFTLGDFFRRSDRIAALSTLRALYEGVDFDFPREEAEFRWDETLASDKAARPLADSISTSSATAVIGAGKLAVVADTLALGIDVHKLGAIHHFDENGTEEELDEEEEQPPAEFTLPDSSEIAAIQKQLELFGEPPAVRTTIPLSLHTNFPSRA